MPSVDISVVVPVYNSEHSLKPLVESLNPVLKSIANKYELILVNDGSTDNSAETAQHLATAYPWVRFINLMRNYGQHNALLCGIRAAQHNIIVTMDDDLQNPPEEIVKLITRLQEGYDVVYGYPQNEKHGFLRHLASRATKLVLQHAMGAETASSVSSFRVFRTQIRDAFHHYDGSSVFIDAMLTWGTAKFTAIPVRQDARLIGNSTYTFAKLIKHALNLITAFSTLPLQLASLIGFIFTVFGLVMLVYVLADFFFRGDVVRGFPFLASLTAIFSGAQLFALGVIGEYLARVHFRLTGRPAYVIQAPLPQTDHLELR